jgi:hypothetical protein
MMPRFNPGEWVRVVKKAAVGHVRTPSYIRGKRGLVERICGEFRKPEELAYGRSDGEREPLYRVRFAQCEVWPDYAGAPEDTLDVEIYEHWLEKAEDKR